MSIEHGDRVTIEYIGLLEDGSVFTTSKAEVARKHGLDAEGGEWNPLSFVVGANEVIEGLETAVLGLSVGEERTVTVEPAEAYGEYDEERVREYDPETFEGMVGQPPEIGLHVEAQNGLHGDVTAVAEDSVQVDFNHELAGKTLTFELEIMTVE